MTFGLNLNSRFVEKVKKNFVVENLTDDKAKVKAVDVVVTEYRPMEWCKRSVITDFYWSDYVCLHLIMIKTSIKRSGSSNK